MKLTTTIARNLELPSGKTDHIEWDDDFPGFGVRLRAGRKGVKRTWIYQYDFAGRTRRATIGNVNPMGIEDAKKIAGRLQGEVRRGNDPAQQKAEKLERAALIFSDVLKDFLTVQERTTRASTFKGTRTLLGTPCKSLYPMSLPDIKRRDVASVLTPLAASGKKSAHNNVRCKLVTFFNWAIKQGLIEHNPAYQTEKLETKARTRVLSMAELVAISHAAVALTDYSTYVRLGVEVKIREHTPLLPWNERGVVATMTNYSDIIHLLMLTGQRRNEIGELPWSELRAEKTFIDDGLPLAGPAIVLSPERVKNGRKHVVPLSKPAMAILSSRQRDPNERRVFPQPRQVISGHQFYPSRGYGRHKQLLDAALAERGHKLEPWVLHDIRRSVATHMGDMGIQPHVIEEVLNHFRANVYNKSRLEGPKRQALEAWGEYLMAHIEGREPADTVVPFRA